MFRSRFNYLITRLVLTRAGSIAFDLEFASISIDNKETVEIDFDVFLLGTSLYYVEILSDKFDI